MKDIDGLAMRIAPWTIPLLTIGIFVVDVLTPVGIAVSILYVIPMLLTLFTSRERDPIYFCGLATSLLWIGLFLKPLGSPILYGAFNRTLGTTALWIIALVLIRFRRTQQKTVETERELTAERVERAHAEGLMMKAQEARYHADREAVQATVGREEAETQLLVSQLRLEGIIDSAMDAIITVDEGQKVVLFNRAADQMFGCPTREAIGQPLERFLPARFRESHRHHVQMFGQSGVTSRKMGKLGRVMGLRSNGEEFPIEAAISHVAVDRKTYYTVILRDITERVLAQQQLDDTTHRLRVATESGGIGVWDYSIPDNRLMWDERMYALYGYGPGHFPGAYEAWSQRLHPDDKAEAERALQDAIEGRRKFDTEFRLLLPDGTIRFIKADALVLKDKQGTAVRMIGVNSDITDRKRAEAVIRESQRQLTTLIGNLPGFVYRCRNDRDRTFEYLSEGVSDLTGYAVEEYLVQRSVSYGENTHPDDREYVWQEVQAAVAQHYPFEMTYRILAKSGEVRWVWERGEGIYASDGILKYLEGFVTDVTERKRAEHLLRQSEERYRRLIAVSPYAILVNRGDRIIFANDQAIKLFGAVKADEILNKSALDLVHPDYHAAIRERIHELLEGRQVVPVIEEKIVRLDGTSLDVEISAARLVDEEGPAILVMLRDVSERKRLQEQLRRTERIAELGTLASGMAHEIGTPMNVILGRAEYLMDRVTEEPIKKGLQTIITQVERITKVMNQLLAFARRKSPERVPVVLKDIVEDSLELFGERLAKSRVTVELMFEGDCPRVLADPDQVSQVFINLVMNAVHAMPDGGTLRIGLTPEKQMVKLTVADTGHGIPRDLVKKIFEPFYTTKEFGQGTGLGLTVVKGIIEEHQGSIAVESEEGRGTTFTILLPRADNG